MDIYRKFKLYGFCKFIKYSVLEIHRLFYWNLLKRSYSQGKEDVFIDRFLKNKKKGFYVDVGANDPSRFNNTKRFYKRGWQGINVEPNVILINKINRERKRDINLNIGIGKAKGEMMMYVFYPDTLSTFSREKADEYIKQGFAIEKESKIEIRTLKDVLDQYAKGAKIDFLTVDTEGTDLDVLQSNDWNNYRPTLLCVEVNNLNGHKFDIEILQKYLESVNYEKINYNGRNAIYFDSLSKKY